MSRELYRAGSATALGVAGLVTIAAASASLIVVSMFLGTDTEAGIA